MGVAVGLKRKRDVLPPGITRRHARSCPAYKTDDMDICRCRPSYPAVAGPRKARKTKTHRTLAAAKTWKRDMDRAFERGERTIERAPRLRDAAEAWLDAAEKGIALARGDKPYKPSTLRGYRRCMENELYRELGGDRLDAITRGRLNQFVQGLQARGLAAQTVKNVVIPLRALYRHAHDLDQVKVTINPTRGVRVPGGSGKRLRFATPEEIGPQLAALHEKDRPLWATAIYAGLRRGELMALRWADVDLAAGVIRVELNYDPGEKEMVETKSTAGDRKVPICGALREHLLVHRQRAGARPTGLVFARASLGGHCRRASRHEPFSDGTIGARAKKVWNNAGVRHLTLHDCRHTFASLMIAAMAAAGTFNPKTIQTMLGHASIQQTYDRYGHLFPGAEEEAARMLDDFLEGFADFAYGKSGNSATDESLAEVAQAATQLVAALEQASPAAALPEVTQARDALETWLQQASVIPSVTPTVQADSDHPVCVQRTGIRRVP